MRLAWWERQAAHFDSPAAQIDVWRGESAVSRQRARGVICKTASAAFFFYDGRSCNRAHLLKAFLMKRDDALVRKSPQFSSYFVRLQRDLHDCALKRLSRILCLKKRRAACNICRPVYSVRACVRVNRYEVEPLWGRPGNRRI